MRHARIDALLISGVILTAATQAMPQSCQPYWSGVGPILSGLADSVTPFPIDGVDRLVAGGRMTVDGAVALVMWWDGHRWTAMDSGLPHLPYSRAYRLYVLDDGSGPTLYALGANSLSVPEWMKRWNGIGWQDLPPGMYVPNTYEPWFSFDDGTGPHLYGWHNDPVQFIAGAARWDGTQWVDMGAVSSNQISCFAALDVGRGPELYVAGDFNRIGGTPARNVARWDGLAWHGLGGLPPKARAVCVYDDGSGPALYIGGNAGDTQEYTPLYKYDGQSMSPVLGLTSSGIFQINGLAVFDDGSGPALYAAGYVPQGIVRYDGHQWTTLPGGSLITHVESSFGMAVANDGRGESLFLASSEGLHPNNSFGRSPVQYVGCIGQCYPDVNNDHVLNVDDFIAFMSRWASYDPYVDCTQDLQFNAQDFVCFMQRFAAGCQ
jgi:hypothetical protein